MEFCFVSIVGEFVCYLFHEVRQKTWWSFSSMDGSENVMHKQWKYNFRP